MRHTARLVALTATLLASGCTAIAVVDTAATAAVGVTKIAVKGTTAIVSAAIPDGKESKNKSKKAQ